MCCQEKHCWQHYKKQNVSNIEYMSFYNRISADGKIHGGEQKWKSPTCPNNKKCSSSGREDTDVIQRMHDCNIAFRNHDDQPHGGDVHEENGEYQTISFLECCAAQHWEHKW